MPKVDRQGVAIHYETSGGGPPVLFLPGRGLTLKRSRRLIAPLAASFRVVAVDNRGAGLSDKPDAPFTVEDMAEDALAVLEAEGLARLGIVGFSMGGKIACALALAHPGRAGALALISTHLGPYPPSAPGRAGLRATVRGWFESRPERRGKEGQGQASRAFDPSGRLGEIRCPVLMLHGRDDKVAPFLDATRSHGAIAGSELLDWPGGHLIVLRRTAEVMGVACAFLNLHQNA